METERASPRYSDIDLQGFGEITSMRWLKARWRPSPQFAPNWVCNRAGLPSPSKLASTAMAGWSMSAPERRAGLLVQDGAELIPTFNWPSDRLLLLIAGGKDALLRATEGAEDETGAAKRAMQEHDIRRRSPLSL